MPSSFAPSQTALSSWASDDEPPASPGSAWLDDADVSVVDVLGGKIPVSWTHEDTVLVVGVLPELPDEDSSYWAIYLRVAGKVAADDVLALLRGGTAPAEVQRAEILEVGFEPPEP